MKLTTSVLCLVGTIALAAGCVCPTSSVDEAGMIAAAKELDSRFLAAFNKGDVDGMLATYWNSPELVSFPPDKLVCQGWAEVKQHLTNGATMSGLELRLVDMHYRVAGDCVIGWGQWRMNIPGVASEAEGRYTDVKAKRDGKWVFLLDHASAPLPAGE